MNQKKNHTRSGPGVGLSSGPSGMESIGGKVMTSSGESSRIPIILVSEHWHVVLSYGFRFR